MVYFVILDGMISLFHVRWFDENVCEICGVSSYETLGFIKRKLHSILYEIFILISRSRIINFFFKMRFLKILMMRKINITFYLYN